MPNGSESAGGQAYPSWAEEKENFMARTKKVRPILTRNSIGDFIMPTFEELPVEYREAYEVLKKEAQGRI
jgi:hypothetical protein